MVMNFHHKSQLNRVHYYECLNMYVGIYNRPGNVHCCHVLFSQEYHFDCRQYKSFVVAVTSSTGIENKGSGNHPR